MGVLPPPDFFPLPLFPESDLLFFLPSHRTLLPSYSSLLCSPTPFYLQSNWLFRRCACRRWQRPIGYRHEQSQPSLVCRTKEKRREKQSEELGRTGRRARGNETTREEKQARAKEWEDIFWRYLKTSRKLEEWLSEANVSGNLYKACVSTLRLCA